MKGLDARYIRQWSGEEIRLVRKALGFTQQNFAHLIGITQPTVSLWEKSGVEGPNALVLFYIASDCEPRPDGNLVPGPATRATMDARGLAPPT